MLLLLAVEAAFIFGTRAWRARLDPPPVELYQYDWYFSLGMNLRHRGMLSYDGDSPTAFRMPLYPVLIAASQPGQNSAAPRRTIFLNAALDAATVILVFAVGSLALSPACGLLAGAFFACDAAGANYSSTFEIISVFTFLMLGVAFALIRWIRAPNLARSAALGLSIGVSLLFRSTLFALPLVLALWARRRSSRYWPALLLTAYLPLVPWVVRNAWHFHRLVPLEDGAGVENLYLASLGYIDAFHGEATGPNPREIGPARDYPGFAQLDVSEQASLWEAWSVKSILAHPWRYLSSTLARAVFFWRGYALFAALAVLGAWLGWRRPEVRALSILPLYYLLHATMAISPRYAPPVAPLLFLLAASVVLACLRFRAAQPDPRSARPLALALCGFQCAAAILCAGVLLFEIRRMPSGQARVSARAVGLMSNLDQDQRPRALKELQVLALHNPGSTPVLNALGIALFLDGQRPAALAVFARAVEREPLSFSARMSFAAALEAMGRKAESAQNYSEARRLCEQGLGQPALCFGPGSPLSAAAQKRRAPPT